MLSDPITGVILPGTGRKAQLDASAEGPGYLASRSKAIYKETYSNACVKSTTWSRRPTTANLFMGAERVHRATQSIQGKDIIYDHEKCAPLNFMGIPAGCAVAVLPYPANMDMLDFKTYIWVVRNCLII